MKSTISNQSKEPDIFKGTLKRIKKQIPTVSWLQFNFE